jgi:hypothetical protein
MEKPDKIVPPKGKLGILLPGMGAVRSSGTSATHCALSQWENSTMEVRSATTFAPSPL